MPGDGEKIKTQDEIYQNIQDTSHLVTYLAAFLLPGNDCRQKVKQLLRDPSFRATMDKCDLLMLFILTFSACCIAAFYCMLQVFIFSSGSPLVSEKIPLTCD